jgi:putative glutamine amidotransferase
MSIRIAIPEPASSQYVEDALSYNQRSLPQYLAALHSAGATAIPIPLHESPERIAKILSTTAGILLPGSGADIDPARYGQDRAESCDDPDPARWAVDTQLLDDAFRLRKPVLAICHGVQGMNVWLGGSLIQDIPSQIGSAVDHAPGRTVLDAHPVEIAPGSLLASLTPASEPRPLLVNSSHHQSVLAPANRLVVVARCPIDGVVEAVELVASTDKPQWVLGVQWHPERTYLHSALSRAIFAGFARAAEGWGSRRVEEALQPA